MDPDPFVMFVMRIPQFNRATFCALWLPPILCFVVSGALFWWGTR